jgi:hypothetical protein
MAAVLLESTATAQDMPSKNIDKMLRSFDSVCPE